MLDTSGFKKGFTEARSQMNTFLDSTSSFNTKVGALGGMLSSVGGSLTKYVTTPLIGAGTALVAFASDSESAFSKFQAKVGEVTGDMNQYKDVMDAIYKNNYGEDYEDIADAMGEVVNRLGELDGEELQNVTESAFALRSTFEYEVSESIRSVDTLMKNFGLTSEEAFDYIAKGTQEGLNFSDEFLDTINEYSVQFKKLGLDADDMFSILKEGADSGAWNLDKIGDAIKEFSIRAVDGSNTTIEGFEALGFSADSMAAKFAAGGDSAKEAFQQVIAALNDMSDPVQQNLAGVNLFGTMWEDLGPEVVSQLANITEAAVDTSGAMESLKEVRYDNLNSAIQGLGRSLKVAGANLGEYLIPYVEKAINFVDGLVDKFDALDEPTKELIVNIGLVAAAVGPALLVAGKAATTISSIVSLIGGAGGLSAVLAAVTGPIGIVVAAVAALAAAWATNFGGIQEKTQSIINSIKDIISSGWELITGLWNDNFLFIQDIASTVWENIELTFSTVLDNLVLVFDTFAKILKGDWTGAWENVQEIAENIWDLITTRFENFLDLVVRILLSIASSLLSAAKSVFNKVKDGFESVWESITSWFSRAVNDPVGTILDIGSALYDAGRDIFNSLWDGLKSVWDSITGWVEDGVNWIVSKVKFWESESEKINRNGGFGSNSSGSFSSGLDYVPRTMKVTVHEGERILTKEENQAYGKTVQARLQMNVTFTQPVDQTTAKKVSRELAKETEKELRGKGVVLV